MTDTVRTATNVVRKGGWSGAADKVVLDYDGRFVRRKRLVTEAGQAVLLDLPQMTSLDGGDAIVTDDGLMVEVVAAPEDLAAVSAAQGSASLARLAWHIGNRHTPCQIAEGRLLIRRDPVLENMLRGLGATVAPVSEPFLPEGGAYGHGRTMGHDHGPDHGPDHGHDHDHHRRVHHHASHRHDDAEDGEPEA